MATKRIPKTEGPKDVLDVFDHQSKQWGQATRIGFEQLKAETLDRKGTRILRYTLTDKVTPAPKKKAEE